MKVKLLGKNLDDLRPLLGRFGMEEADRDFELIITHGGDGALLGAEREYPGVPKLPLRDAATAPTCCEHELRRRLRHFADGSAKLSKLPKLEALVRDQRLFAINDVFLLSADRRSALRYRVRIDGELYAGEVMGDGVGLASLHGSSAYYRSITHSLFRVGIGLAFSNSTEEVDHLVLSEKSVVEIEVVRGPGIVVADNAPDMPPVEVGECVTMRQSDKFANIYDLAGFMCPLCRRLRHPNQYC